MQATQLGSNGPRVARIGLGCMGLSDLHGTADGGAGIATIRAALDAGVTLLDTADFYGMGDNEMLIRAALAGRRRDEVVLGVKFGALRGPDGAWNGADCRPQAVKNFAAYSLKRLGVEHIDIYRPARLDPAVPLEDTVGAIADLVRAGYVRHIGLADVGADTLRRAQAVHPISDVQAEYSLVARGIEREILPTARALGIGITAYGVLSRGLLSGHWSTRRAGEPDFRSQDSTRYQGDDVEAGLALAERLRAIAAEKGATVAQLAIAWVMAQGADIVPLVGARRQDCLQESLDAAALALTAADLARIEAQAPPSEFQVGHLDSELG